MRMSMLVMLLFRLELPRLLLKLLLKLLFCRLEVRMRDICKRIRLLHGMHLRGHWATRRRSRFSKSRLRCLASSSGSRCCCCCHGGREIGLEPRSCNRRGVGSLIAQIMMERLQMGRELIMLGH